MIEKQTTTLIFEYPQDYLQEQEWRKTKGDRWVHKSKDTLGSVYENTLSYSIGATAGRKTEPDHFVDANKTASLDLISRQEAIDFIDAGHLVNGNEPRWSDYDVVNFLKSRPSAEPGWIPCAERLPEASGAYLVTCANGNVKVGHFATFDGKWTDAKAVAWMPLPEAYEGGDGHGEV